MQLKLQLFGALLALAGEPSARLLGGCGTEKSRNIGRMMERTSYLLLRYGYQHPATVRLCCDVFSDKSLPSSRNRLMGQVAASGQQPDAPEGSQEMCAICESPQRREIEADMAAMPERAVAAKWAVNRNQIQKHRRRCMKQAATVPATVRRVANLRQRIKTLEKQIG